MQQWLTIIEVAGDVLTFAAALANLTTEIIEQCGADQSSSRGNG